LIADDDHPNVSFVSAEELKEWKAEARIAVFWARKPVLEDGLDISG
jgi:hypothetical protein